AFLQRHVPPQASVTLMQGNGIPEKIGVTFDRGSGAPYSVFALGLLVDRRPGSFGARIPFWPDPYDRFLDDGYALGSRYLAFSDVTPGPINSSDPEWELRAAQSRS